MAYLGKEPKISIHAPVKGATLSRPYVLARLDISIHAPVKGATNDELWHIQKKIFQSTLP